MTKKLLQQALNVLRGCLDHPDAADAIAELEAAIAQPAPDRDDTPESGMLSAPHYRGYANLGSGQYILNHTAELPAELIISIATEEEKADRAVGDSRGFETRSIIQPDDMAVRLRFENAAGLDAFEQQLQFLREEFFPETVAAIAQPAVTPEPPHGWVLIPNEPATPTPDYAECARQATLATGLPSQYREAWLNIFIREINRWCQHATQKAAIAQPDAQVEQLKNVGPLSDAEIEACAKNTIDEMHIENLGFGNLRYFVRAIEAAHAIAQPVQPVAGKDSEIERYHYKCANGQRCLHGCLSKEPCFYTLTQPTTAEYAQGYAEGFNDACKPKSQPVQPAPHNLQKRLADLHLYQEITQYYAKCDPTPEALRDWVVERGAL